MSTYESEGSYVKKRRVTRACDSCRRRKGKCNGRPDSGLRCATCVSLDVACTYRDPVEKRGPRPTYVKELERRVAMLQRELQRVKEGSSETPVDPLSRLYSTMEPGSQHSVHSTVFIRCQSHTPFCDESSSEDEPEQGPALYETFAKLDMKPRPIYTPSSTHEFLVSSMRLDREFHTHTSSKEWAQKNPWDSDPWELEDEGTAEYILHQHRYSFPDEDLISLLVDSYFTHYNAFLPLLHRPTFEYNLTERSHLRDPGFGAIVLAVCALGARYIEDERVYLPGCPPRSAGWCWYNQLRIARRPLLGQPRLCDVQLYILAAFFLTGSSNGVSLWTLVGIAQRQLIHIGAHTQRFYSKTPNLHDELWKRAFWVTLCLDRIVATEFGRPILLRDDDYDAPYPIDCDDEFWTTEDPTDAFMQPPDKPSSLTFFIQYIQLQKIRAFVMHNLISSKTPRGSTDVQDIVVQIDSDMNQWLDSLPEHLRWDSLRKDTLFFHQSATLHTEFHALQIVVHRPIAASRIPSPSAFMSLAVCSNAARSSSHILSIQAERPSPPIHSLTMMIRAFNAAIVLVLSMHSEQRSGSHVNITRELQDVQKCIDVLARCSTKSLPARFFLRILTHFTSPERRSLLPAAGAPTEQRPHDLSPTKMATDELANTNVTWQVAPSTHLAHRPELFHANGDVRPTSDPTLKASAVLSPPTGPWLDASFAPSHTGHAPSPSTGWASGPAVGDLPVITMSGASPDAVSDELFALWADVPSGLGVWDWTSYLEGLDGSSTLPTGFNGHF